MIHIAPLADNRSRRLPFYLAMEEWIARSLPPDEYFFAWAVAPTVICGRNQDMAAEVDMAYCKAHSIDVVRRKSGGGCVYADPDNLMLSHITPSEHVTTTFSRYTAMVARALQAYGLDAQANGRNDILIGDRKVSGNAFYHLPGRSIVHGTLLCDIDMERMLRAITPAKAKLESKMVKSVESRVTCIREHKPEATIEQVRQHLISTLTSGEITLTPQQVKEIEAIEAQYYTREWMEGRKLRPAARTMRKDTRIDGIGLFSSRLALNNDGRIADAALFGDFFTVADTAEVLDRIKGLTAQQAADALMASNAASAVPSLSKEQLVEVLGLTTTTN